ncbi:hypothetical protein SH2C18_05760 [Clostridium sediminicola]|uniref:GntR family transcriptional regulator n=1 Tax=Clostridium sediminicola TaxID=3114879 RepID=UPI0031F20E28
MNLEITIDRDIDKPIYKQIIEQIISGVRDGLLKAGDKLPPERELANELNTSRGTVTKAYRELENIKVIEVIQGRGSYISSEQDVRDENRKEKAIKIINETIDSLTSIGFSYKEIKIFIDILMLEREKNAQIVSIATVDCNPEALNIFKKQLEYIKNVTITRFLLDDLKKSEQINELLSEYDLIITTVTHYNQLLKLIPKLTDRVIRGAVAPSQQTIINFAKFYKEISIGIICYSRRFSDIIKNTLETMQIKINNVSYTYVVEDTKSDLEEFLKAKDVIIIPSDSDIILTYDNEINRFKSLGGKIIEFQYQIERGTLIYIEEKITRIIKEKNI